MKVDIKVQESSSVQFWRSNSSVEFEQKQNDMNKEGQMRDITSCRSKCEDKSYLKTYHKKETDQDKTSSSKIN